MRGETEPAAEGDRAKEGAAVWREWCQRDGGEWAEARGGKDAMEHCPLTTVSVSIPERMGVEERVGRGRCMAREARA